MPSYSIWLLQCGQGARFPRSVVYMGAHNEGTLVLPFGYVVIKGEGHVALVDTGYNYRSTFGRRQADLEGITDWRSPQELLPLVGLTPAEVDTLIITHAHWDHLGDLEAFPNATVYLQAEELKQWIWAMALPRRFSWLRGGVDPEQIHFLLDRSQAGQLCLVSGEARDVLPGIDLRPAHETHSFAHQYVVVNTTEGEDAGPWVIPGDTVFAFGNLEGVDGSGVYRPMGSCMSQRRVIEVFDEIMGIVGHRAGRVIPVHDCEAWTRFPSRETFPHLHLAEVTLAPGERSRL